MDNHELITDFVCAGLGENTNWLDEHLTIGFEIDGQIIGGLIYHNIRPGRDVWWTLYTTNKRWCTRKNLQFMFCLAFNVLGCQRISMLTDIDNAKCLKLATKLGFQIEGILRKYRDNGKDAVLMSKLKSTI